MTTVRAAEARMKLRSSRGWMRVVGAALGLAPAGCVSGGGDPGRHDDASADAGGAGGDGGSGGAGAGAAGSEAGGGGRDPGSDAASAYFPLSMRRW